jgi:hypothetical protein
MSRTRAPDVHGIRRSPRNGDSGNVGFITRRSKPLAVGPHRAVAARAHARSLLQHPRRCWTSRQPGTARGDDGARPRRARGSPGDGAPGWCGTDAEPWTNGDRERSRDRASSQRAGQPRPYVAALASAHRVPLTSRDSLPHARAFPEPYLPGPGRRHAVRDCAAVRYDGQGDHRGQWHLGPDEDQDRTGPRHSVSFVRWLIRAFSAGIRGSRPSGTRLLRPR